MTLKTKDRVMLQKTGLPTVGTIEGIMIPSCYFGIMNNYHKYERWDECYPDWLEKNIILIKYDSPQRPYSWEEYPQDRKDLLGEELAKIEYNNTPLVERVFAPEDDVILFDDL